MTAIDELYFVKVGAYYLSSMPKDRLVSENCLLKSWGDPTLVPSVALAFMYNKELAEDYKSFLGCAYKNVKIVETSIEFKRIALLN